MFVGLKIVDNFQVTTFWHGRTATSRMNGSSLLDIVQHKKMLHDSDLDKIRRGLNVLQQYCRRKRKRVNLAWLLQHESLIYIGLWLVVQYASQPVLFNWHSRMMHLIVITSKNVMLNKRLLCILLIHSFKETQGRDPFSFAPRYALVSSHNVQCQQYPCCLITWLYRAKCTQTAFWHNRGSKRCHMRWRTFYSLQINVIDSPLEICDEARSLSTAFSSLIFSLWSIKLVGLL